MTGDDLTEPALAEALGGRPVRAYPALLSTQADALAWARAGAPDGAVVVADYQAAPRGRGGLPWRVEPGVGLGFSLVSWPARPVEREGWLYTVAVSALADVLGPATEVDWPDTVLVGGRRAAALGVDSDPEGGAQLGWAVTTVLVEDVQPPRGPLLAEVVAAVEDRLAQAPDAVRADYRPRCRTLGRQVCARMVPLGPAGPAFTGEAVDAKADGALVLAVDERRVAVRPQHLGRLDQA